MRELHEIVVKSESILEATLSKDANAVAELLGEVRLMRQTRLPLPNQGKELSQNFQWTEVHWASSASCDSMQQENQDPHMLDRRGFQAVLTQFSI
jgi:hypothetical protein